MKAIFLFLLVLNLVVLMGQVWPQYAPPFATIVNIITVFLNVVYFVIKFLRRE